MKRFFFILLLFLCCCQNKKYYENKFFIKENIIQMVDYIGEDSTGRNVFKDFDINRENSYSGIHLQLIKRFYSDSTHEIGFFSMYSPRGMGGRGDSIISIKLYLANNMIEITDSLKGIDELKSRIDEYGFIKDKNSFFINEYYKFESISDFITRYNTTKEFNGQDSLINVLLLMKKDYIRNNKSIILDLKTNDFNQKHEIRISY